LDPVTVIYYAIPIAIVVLCAADSARRRARRCRKCQRPWALRRVRGTRREGFVRYECKYCGAKQWGVDERDDGPFIAP
jgi:hypothetical protein